MVRFDPFSYVTQDDPYPVYRRLRDEAPAYWSEEHGFWALSRHADVLAALKDPRRFSNRHGITLEKGYEEQAVAVFSILAMDPPRHDQVRGLASQGFTPRRIAALEPRIRELAHRHLDAMRERGGRADLVRDFAGPIPMTVICDLLGVPEADREELRSWSDTMLHREEGSDAVPPAAMEASVRMRAYFAGWVADAKRRTRDDLAGTILRAEVEGERLSPEEVIGFLFLLVVAGNETTRNLLGNAVYQLWRHPEVRARVRAEPELVPAWVEETLRYDTSTQALARTVTGEVALHGARLRDGDRALLLLGSANRDERVFPRADVFEPGRDTAASLAFGKGTHFCLGASLARLEARVALAAFRERVPDFALDEQGLRRVRSTNVRGFAALPAELGVEPSA